MLTPSASQPNRDAADARRRPQDHPPNPLPQQSGPCAGQRDTPRRARALPGAARGAHARGCVPRRLVMSLCGFAVALMLDTPVEPRCVAWETSYTNKDEEVGSVNLRLVLGSPSPLVMCTCTSVIQISMTPAAGMTTFNAYELPTPISHYRVWIRILRNFGSTETLKSALRHPKLQVHTGAERGRRLMSLNNT